ncbi:hypothetical protein BOTBODRAFT_187702 [Botryobasidium botryosum FD-172 SS1]|uniref:Prolyl 4-hydroxylase alpha subunit Fe(2+) 2OG dioxygenase domain-containing protein n=1 Tax=Botryobasidium botryosum (strain FD-172 SS1) TaxID=930990 RepID=A0A067MS10_BOTB1|nr:hypothetical protein BOTBODRAFT_187702 [Botryobasidium botryosum FD-172 SS1]
MSFQSSESDTRLSSPPPPPSAALDVKAIQDRLVDALSDHTQQPFYCSGKFKVAPNDLDVLDETYRKAGKMDSDHFALNFNPTTTGLLEHVREELFGLRYEMPNIRAELYKLNVYGPGSFFKSHVDTPQGKKMFGSLVIVLPTSHEGGALHLRHSGKAFIYDSAHELSSQVELSGGGPSIGYVAFYSDVEHEVMEVMSGYRARSHTTSTSTAPLRGRQRQFAMRLSRPYSASFFRSPLSFQKGDSLAWERLRPLLDCLKGADAALLAALRHHGFKPLLYAAYDFGNIVVISETVLDLEDVNEM